MPLILSLLQRAGGCYFLNKFANVVWASRGLEVAVSGSKVERIKKDWRVLWGSLRAATRRLPDSLPVSFFIPMGQVISQAFAALAFDRLFLRDDVAPGAAGAMSVDKVLAAAPDVS